MDNFFIGESSLEEEINELLSTNRWSCQKWSLYYSAAAKEFMLKLYFTRDSIVWDAARDSRS
jgi:hypothetical protein